MYGTSLLMYSEEILVEDQKYILRNSINQLLNQHNWNLKTLSDRSCIPYETIKKIANAKIDRPSLYSVSKIANAFQCSLDELVGHPSSGKDPHPTSSNFLLLLETLSAFQQSFRTTLLHPKSGMLPILCPNCSEIDGMPFTEASFFYHNFSSYQSRFGDHLLCGIKITNQSLMPMYKKDSLLLIGDEPPVKGPSVGVYLQCRHLYLRTYQAGHPPRLESITKKGAPIILETPSNWHTFGYVLAQIQSPV